MNCDDIIRMAREAGFEADEPANDVWITDGYWADTAGMKLYSAPPKREPLNTDLILARWANECVPNRSTPELVVAFARAIEQEHGIGGEE